MTLLVCLTLAYIVTFSGVIYYVVNRSNRKTQMAVLAAFQPSIDSLNDSASKIAALVASPTLPEGAASAQDVTDTLDAVQAAAAGVAAPLNPAA